MASSAVPRSRSPVMSIRTQPEDEDSLRAEIEAAKRTQHEILPRYSWHSNPNRKDSTPVLRKVYPSVLYREAPTSRLARGPTFCEEADDEESFPATTTPLDTIAQLNSIKGSRTPWRQSTKRRMKADLAKILPAKFLSFKDPAKEKEKVRHSRSQKPPETKNYNVADEDREAQYAQFDAWLQEQLNEKRHFHNIDQIKAQDCPRDSHKQAKNSRSASKSSSQSASKGSLEKWYGRVMSAANEPPHLYSFEKKEQLEAYLNDAAVISPISTTALNLDPITSLEKPQPVELSAGPLPVELEGTAPDTFELGHNDVSCTSTPSVRDLPPYVDEKKLSADIKDDTFRPDPSRIESFTDSYNGPAALYTCTSCQHRITGEDIYDFCSLCGSEDRITCYKCAQQGFNCQHEVERQIATHVPSSSSSDTSATPCDDHGRRKVDRQTPVTFRGLERNQVRTRTNSHGAIGRDSQMSSSASQINGSEKPELQTQPQSSLNDLRANLFQELNHLRQENELAYRERELTLRAREIELRDQQCTLREREFFVQQKNDMFMRNLETICSHQQLDKNTFISAQLHTCQAQNDRCCVYQKLSNPDVEPGMSESNHVGSDAQCHRQSTQSLSDGICVEGQKPEIDIKNATSYIKSGAAHKRKKERDGHNSASSTPTAVSSPDNARKSLSRGNSERNESQDEDGEDNDEHRSPKKNKHEPQTPASQQLLFACPYSKFNPLRFSSRNSLEKNYRGCGTHYLPDVSRLKQHLKRVHWQPEAYCPRCYREFENASRLFEHAQASVACIAKECPFPEKMDRTQQEKIHVKRPRVPPETVWYDIYKVLFPGAGLPESPYMEADDRLLTPLSATPQDTINSQAIQTISNIFNRKMSQSEELRDHPLCQTISQTLVDSMTEFLGSYSLSPALSPVGGPSIVVSPVSRSSSGKTETTDNESALATEAGRSGVLPTVTVVSSRPQQVPRLQQPKPRSRPWTRTTSALQVPPDNRRSPSSHTRPESPRFGNAAEAIFDVHIPAHVLEDQGYGDESLSFEKGDDLQAMSVMNQPLQISSRSKSMVSLDSGYGSGRSHHPSHQSLTVPNNSMDKLPETLIPQDHNISDIAFQTDPARNLESMFDARDIHEPNPYQSYSNYLEPSFQELFYGVDDPFSSHNNPWNIP